ncbi:MAG TPA: hypothetical protein VHY21_20295 [Pseudonocardiaceae bacterium]|nr:hypothetical protein [Pseudonocardiaceae bacterium]
MTTTLRTAVAHRGVFRARTRVVPGDWLCPGLGEAVRGPGRHRACRARGVGKALREPRRRLGAAPFEALFEVVAGPLAQPWTPGVCFAGMRTVAFDRIDSLKIPDTERNRCWIGRVWYRLTFAGYPTLRLMCLVETGTRGLLGVVISGTVGTPGDRDEAHLARRLLRLLGPGMLLLADRAFDSATFLAEVERTGAKLCSGRRPGIGITAGER